MASSLLYFVSFFFNLACLSLLSAQQPGKHYSDCPDGYFCEKFGEFGFPFTNLSYQGCGLFLIDSSDVKKPQVQFLNPERWYHVERLSYSEKEIVIHDLHLQDQLDSNSCLSLDNITVPQSSSLKFSFASFIVPFFKCKRESSIDPPPEFIQALNYNLYFKEEPEESLPPLPETFINICSPVSLPRIQGWDTSKKRLASVFTAHYSLSWEILPDCENCRKKLGGLCMDNKNGTFDCVGSKNGILTTRRNNGLKIGIASSIVGAFIVAMCVLYCSRRILSKKYWLRRRSENPPNVEEFLRNYWSLSPKRYKYSDVRKMTNSFKEKLGQGGYGSVFKGQLLDGRVVAVKVLDKSNKGNGEEFVNEIVSISRTSHVNIVALLGFCIEGPKRALIYEFMPNGSLEKFIYIDKLSKTGLQDHQQLGWDTLFKIAVGIAQGLEYLHRGCYTRIVHFDIKPHNILLDHDFNPKISDFGMSKLCLKKESTMSTIGARGTIGYIAPEVVLRTFGKVSHKSDVYSYGMMVLEMVGQRRNVDAGVDNTSEIYFPHWIYKRLDQFEQLGLCGATTAGEKELSRKMTIVALWCIQVDSLHRPSMNKVLDMLEGRIEDLDIPPMPTFSSSVSPVHQEICSTISVL